MRRASVKCTAEYTLSLIGGRWKVLILWQLSQGTKRFSELMRALEGVTQKMLTQQLREMEKDGLLVRTVFPQVPPRVEYSLTRLGQSLKPVVESMCKWGVKHADDRLNQLLVKPPVGELGARQRRPQDAA